MVKVYAHRKLLELEEKIHNYVQQGKILKARLYVRQYNATLAKVRARSRTDLPFYKVKALSELLPGQFIVEYALECGFCGADNGQFHTNISADPDADIRSIRSCGHPECEHKAQRYHSYKVGLIEAQQKPGFMQKLRTAMNIHNEY